MTIGQKCRRHNSLPPLLEFASWLAVVVLSGGPLYGGQIDRSRRSLHKSAFIRFTDGGTIAKSQFHDLEEYDACLLLDVGCLRPYSIIVLLSTMLCSTNQCN